MLVFNPTVKNGEDLNFKVENKKTRKAIKVPYDRLKKYKTREKPFTPEPRAIQKTTIKEQKNTNLNCSDDSDIIEIESSTDTESNLNTENQSEAEDDFDSLNVTNDTTENEAKESEQETSEGQDKAQNVAEKGGASSSNLQSTMKKSRRNKNCKTGKKPQESSSKTKSTEENNNSDLMAPKMATRSSSRLKSVSEKLKNYFTEQDENPEEIMESKRKTSSSGASCDRV